MKTLKKIMAFAVCLVMVLAMTVTAFADDTSQTYTITAPAGEYQYEIYQIFTGTFANGKLGNIKWGKNGTGTEGEAVAAEKITTLTGLASDNRTVLNEIETNYVNLNTTAYKTLKGGDSVDVPAGYYLIKDAGSSSISGNDQYTTYIVQVVKNLTFTRKVGVPSFEKKVKDTNDTNGTTTGWQDSADYDIGDQVPFELVGTVAANYSDYKQYYFAFHDVMEKGLTFDEKSVKVYLDDSTTAINSSYYTVNYDANNKQSDKCTFEVVFSNLKNITGVTNGTKIRVEYTAELNTQAQIGEKGNLNTAHLEYSNNPNEEQNGSNKPKTGETPDDTVIVFTYKLVVNKVDENNHPLGGAEFTLIKKLSDNSTKTITAVKSDADTTFTFTGLDDGEYILKETTTPNGYNPIADMTFKVEAGHVTNWTNEARNEILTDLTGTKVEGEITLTGTKADGTLQSTVVNKPGSTLPSTGGIGTRIFYIIGGLLMAAAAVVLITKVRFNKNK